MVGPNNLIVSTVECETGIMRSIYSSNELIEWALRGSTIYSDPVGIMNCGGVFIHELQDLASVRQHDLRIKAPNKR